MAGLANGSTQAWEGSPQLDGAGYYDNPLSSVISNFMNNTIAAGFAPIYPPFLANVSTINGAGYTALQAVPTVPLSTPQFVYVLIGGVVQLWCLVAGTSTGGDGFCLPADYNAITNAKYWVQLQ